MPNHNAAQPVLSVVLINKNERGVADTLRLLDEQQCSVPFEAIVVDASGGALDDVYSLYPDVRTIPFTSKSTKKITIPEQRNVGIRAAKGDIIVFIDAGCEPGTTWLQELTDVIVRGDEYIAAGGTLSSGGKTTFHDVVYKQQLHEKYIGQAPTINLAIAKQVFDEVGYFDENLRYGSDMDFTWRARRAGYRIRNVPAALITHDWGGLKAELKRANHYGQAKIILYRKHRYGLPALMKREFALFFYIGFVLLLPLTVVVPWYPLLILVPVLKNLRTNPFKLVLVNMVTAYGAVKEFVTP
jgi:glycosyltransferase involved in cell wall biosynthesis